MSKIGSFPVPRAICSTQNKLQEKMASGLMPDVSPRSKKLSASVGFKGFSSPSLAPEGSIAYSTKQKNKA